MKRYRLLMITVLLTMVGRILADNLTVNGVTIKAGETQQVSIVLNNPSHQYAAFQFDLLLPEGVSIAKNANGKLIASLNEDRKDDHMLTVTDVGGGTYRFLSFSMSNAEFYGTDGALVDVMLEAASEASVGAKTATIKSQVFTEVSGTQYKWAEVPFQITVEEPVVPVTITAKSYSREYGEANPAFEFTSSGATLNGTPEITCEATETSPVGTYPIVIKKGSVTNSGDTYVNGTLTITKAPLTISGGAYSMKQGEELPTFKAVYSGWKNSDTEAVLTKKPTLTTTATSGSTPGTYDVNVAGAEANNYDISYNKGTLTIMEADPITVTVKNVSRQYGQANPTFEYTVEGGTLDGTPEISCLAMADSDVGTYDITINKGTVKNYNVTFVGSKLTITKAPLTIKAGIYTRKQGDDNPLFTLEYTGFKNGETETVLTKQPIVTCNANETSAPGEYAVMVSGAEAQNYEINYVDGKLIVMDADVVVIIAKSYTREYGENNPEFEFTTEGTELDGEPMIECSATATSAVGTYDIVITKGGVKNYNDTYVNGTLTITKAPLTIKVGNYSRKQGEENPEFVLTYEGFKNGETAEVLTAQPTVKTEAVTSTEPGKYAITISGAEAQNYEITYVLGELTVMEADPVTLRAMSYTREYGEENPTFEFTTEGAVLDGEPVIECEATIMSPVGTYDIVIKKGGVKNYNDSYVNGTLTITKAPLTIKAGTYTKKQGEENPEFSLTYEGFKNNETKNVLTKQPTISCEATESSAPGEYTVKVINAEAQNYAITCADGKLIVLQADAVAIMAKNYSREYGDGNPVFEYEVSGAELDGTPEISCEATVGSEVGTYTIVVKQGSVKNFNVSYINGTLTITKAPLMVNVKDVEREQGEENPQFELVYEGWKLQDSESVLLKKPVATTTATKNSPSGDYVITVGGGETRNYELRYVNGKLTVTMPSSIHEVTESATFDVYDMSGRKVRRQATMLMDLPKGVYIIDGRKRVVK